MRLRFRWILIFMIMVGVGCAKTPSPYTLSVRVQGSGTITPATQFTVYETITQVILKAIPHEGWVFSHWEGPVESPYHQETVVIVDGERSVQAVFTEISTWQFFYDETLDTPIQIVDLGLWLDGFEGPFITIYLYNGSDENRTVNQLEVKGDDAAFFDVVTVGGQVSAGGFIAVDIRYRGEVDPGELELKQASLEVISTSGVGEVGLVALPVIDASWALHSMLADEMDKERLGALIERFAERTYPQAQLALGILNVHMFVQGDGDATFDVAMAAYQALQASAMDTDLRRAYEGVASGFLASILGVNGGAYIDAMQAQFELIEPTSASWLAHYWKGVTYLRTAEALMSNAFARLIYGNRVNTLWVPSGTAALTQVMAHYEQASLDDTVVFNGFEYDRADMPVPYEIIQDLLTVPYFN